MRSMHCMVLGILRVHVKNATRPALLLLQNLAVCGAFQPHESEPFSIRLAIALHHMPYYMGRWLVEGFLYTAIM